MARALSVAFALAALLFTNAALAETLHAVALVTRDDDKQLVSRIAGQVADLDVVLDAVEASPPTDLAAQLKQADAVAAEHHARVVVWTLPQIGGLLLCISEPLAGRVLVRKLSMDESSDASTSALLEQAALVVRAALRALAAGGTIGVERRVYEPEPPRPPPPRPPLVARRSAVAGLGGVGAEATVDDKGGHGALALWLGARSRSFEGRLEASLGAPVDTQTQYLTFHVVRDAIVFVFGVSLVANPTVDLTVGLRAGASLFVRSSRDVAPFIAASGRALTAAGDVGAEVRLHWRPSGAFGFVLAIGADALLARRRSASISARCSSPSTRRRGASRARCSASSSVASERRSYTRRARLSAYV